VIVDHEKRTRPVCDLAKPPGQCEQLASSKCLVPQLNDVSSSTHCCIRHLDDTLGRRVRGDDVKVSGEKPL
jgi:hypothetical protein